MSHGRPLIFGEVLFDCFPDGREVLGGAPFNVAWNLQAFGQRPLLISSVGDDSQGMLIKQTMESWSMDTQLLDCDPARPTGRVEISLAEGEPSFSILPNQAYDHISSVPLPTNEVPSFLYHGSLALRDTLNRNTLAGLKRNYPCPIFLDVNLRNPWWQRDTVLALIDDATWLKLNDDECRVLFPDEQDLNSCGSLLLDRFNLDAVFLTKGSKGATVFTRKSSPVTVEPGTVVEVVDTVGAGDAFSSVLLLGLRLNWPVKLTLDRAQEFASSVVGIRGAINQDRAFYQTIFDNWMQQ